MGDGAKARPKVEITTADTTVTIMEPIRELRVEDHDRLIDEARISIDDSFGLASYGIQPGQEVGVEIGWDDEFTKIFDGTVVEIEGSMGADADSSVTTVVAHDRSAALHNASNTIVAQEGEKLSQLVRRIMRDHHGDIAVGQVACDPDPTFEAPNLPRSMGRTDFQFLQYLASTWGYRCFVEWNDGQSQFYFKSISSLWAAKPLGALQMCRGWGEIRTFTYERVADRAARQLVSASVDPRSGDTVRSDSGPVTPTPTRAAAVSSSVATAEPGIAAATGTLAAGASAPPPVNPPRTVEGGASDPARSGTDVVADPTQVSGLRGSALTAGNVDLRAKGRVTLTGISPWAEGDWWVRRVTHIVRQQPGLGPDQSPVSATYDCSLELTR